MTDVPYPTIITQTRYQGVYEGGTWAAFPPGAHFDSIFDDFRLLAFGDDGDCSAWWTSSAADAVGRGSTPGEAVDDMMRRLQLLTHTGGRHPAFEERLASNMVKHRGLLDRLRDDTSRRCEVQIATSGVRCLRSLPCIEHP